MKRTNEVSKLAGVSRRTLQYYDDEGILVTERSRNNHRLYDKEALEKIWEIMLYKEMGFGLKEIRQLLQATDNKKKEYLRRKIEIVRGEIKKREEQIEFISLILGHGIPQMPEESDGMTYVKSIEELRRGL
ncbi:MerR family transcriptional regulator [Lachnospiraceae bacterium 48-42]|nr:MerR family transcriptional regulator [Dorea sp.]